ncbi:MAG: histidine kinase [Candidatus Thiodiazotropha lotti]|uniref:histidine kinase n=1 Tax=Candidatus Thiodiazotropha endoloripes TaxID=1818881 RepID=A0A1E2USI4_9GAMM|nr:histidine kinase [Candidatus Thiodiazotropha endoloripes]MCG7901569.1 histidine kinase [Candidatus Thiodiazotropha weberae]MCG7990559.1 histidine kinase [Candidatus Thiodiazotropha lotti]MCG8001599.1 histidine kinase [Candidatus Thiodiazotropha lotti]MCW4182213.1 histidine kinase [Candidatus Thiodiazotropha weberae]MCW4193373.1 histidine kinase [Candidatus Thiodiazotropha weberae]
MDNNINYNATQYREDYQLAKRFGVISFIAIILIAIVILFLFRYETARIIQDSTKQSNESLTIATEYTLNDHFVMYLNLMKLNDKKPGEMPLEPMLERALQRMIRDTNVDRVKLYDRSGKVAYSSRADAYDDDDEDNDGFISALSGSPRTVLNYRDSFSIFNSNDHDVNLVQTYVPIRTNESSPVMGVMEIYYDISDYVSNAMRAIIIVMSVTMLLMLFLYTFLLMHIKRSERIIEAQNRITREKKAMLEFLTAKMINAQEDEKKRIAFELHEDVVQTLSGVKMQLEKYILQFDKQDDRSDADQLSTVIIPTLQNAAHKIRAVALDLRPPSLDDFGLKAALNSLVSECHTITTGVQITVDVSVNEELISQDQKSILYRMFKDTLKAICFDEKIDGEVIISLSNIDDLLQLQAKIISKEKNLNYNGQLPGFFVAMQEKTILSGGEFFVIELSERLLEVKAVWSY